jgi:hypothetical protein
MHTSPNYAYSGAMRSGALPLTVQYAGVAGYQVCAGSLNGSRDPDATAPSGLRDGPAPDARRRNAGVAVDGGEGTRPRVTRYARGGVRPPRRCSAPLGGVGAPGRGQMGDLPDQDRVLNDQKPHVVPPGWSDEAYVCHSLSPSCTTSPRMADSGTPRYLQEAGLYRRRGMAPGPAAGLRPPGRRFLFPLHPS